MRSRQIDVSAFLDSLASGLHLTLLRNPRSAATKGAAGTFIALAVVYLAVSVGLEMIEIARPWHFMTAGVLPVLCDCMLTLIAAWIVVEFAGRVGVLWGAGSALLAATILTAAVIQWPLSFAISALAGADHDLLASLVELVSRGWWFLVLLVFSHWISAANLGRTAAAAGLAYAVSAAIWWWLPIPPLVITSAVGVAAVPKANPAPPQMPSSEDSALTTVDVNSSPNADLDTGPDFDAEDLMYRQRDLLDAALSTLAPQRPGTVDLYAVAFAGDAEQDVFGNEVEYAGQLLAKRFDARGRTIVLENNLSTISTRPLATWTNLHRTLEAIARVMDPAEDILLVYLTTHGAEDHELLVDLDPLPLNQIAPDDLADSLATTPSIRWKVIIVNACYSGGFIDALRDDSTLVMTSARADRTSFGCEAESDITYFGRAFLVDALNKTTSLPDAFRLAVKSIANLESEDSLVQSEPQIATSPSIEAKLAAWQARLPHGAAVPFQPASRTRTHH